MKLGKTQEHNITTNLNIKLKCQLAAIINGIFAFTKRGKVSQFFFISNSQLFSSFETRKTVFSYSIMQKIAPEKLLHQRESRPRHVDEMQKIKERWENLKTRSIHKI